MTRRLNEAISILGLSLFFAAAPGSQAQVGSSAGTLVLNGGIRGTIKLNPTNCTAGPGPNFNLTGASGGGWSLLFLKASDPPGKRGAASVQLEGDGYKSYVGAVSSWGWTAKTNSGHLSEPSLNIASNGEAGRIEEVLSVVSSYNGPHSKPVKITASWSSGTCKANE